jgi:hypothetical protein
MKPPASIFYNCMGGGKRIVWSPKKTDNKQNHAVGGKNSGNKHRHTVGGKY